MKKYWFVIAIIGSVVASLGLATLISYIFRPASYAEGNNLFTLVLMTGDILSFIGAVILGIIVYHQDNKHKSWEKKQRESEIKKSALIVYFDLKLALNELLVFYQRWWVEGHKYEKLDYPSMMDLINDTVKSHLYLDDNWIYNVANLRNGNNLDLVETIYLAYGNLINMNKVLIGQLTDENSVRKAINGCEHYFSHIKPLIENAKWEVTVDQKILNQLKIIADINYDWTLPSHHLSGFKIN